MYAAEDRAGAAADEVIVDWVAGDELSLLALERVQARPRSQALSPGFRVLNASARDGTGYHSAACR